uniref:DUF4283 domain-containing protein n=1 Tax=Quercus lobata TaxID=97700 RepID=A0A7N2KYU9_QUELO
MAKELEVLWKKLSFTEEEDEGIEIESSSKTTAKEIGKNCAMMKIMSHKSISLDALRKNMRMLWKPNKGIQISEVEEDLFLEFDGELSLKEIVLKWAPFWIQIFNIPLKCRTKEIGWAIGSKLGEVLEVNVSKSRVRWARCLRMRVRIDVTKRIAQNLKYATRQVKRRNYNMGLGCEEKFCGEVAKVYAERGVGNRHGESGTEAEQRSGLALARGSSKDDGTAYMPNQTNLEPCPLSRREIGVDAPKQQPKSLHENGMVKGLVRKQGEKEAILDEKVLDQPKAKFGATENMLWEIATFHEGAPNFNVGLEPSSGPKNGEGNLISPSVEQDFQTRTVH